MKRAAVFFAAALMVGLLTVQAHAASLYPVSEEIYTYGSFDELRIDKVYELTLFDDPADIPTGDFDRDGYRYTFLNMVKTEQSETDANGNTVATDHDTVIYTATFVCRGKAKTSGQNQPVGTESLDLCLLIILPVLFGMVGMALFWKAHEDGLTQRPKQIKTKELER